MSLKLDVTCFLLDYYVNTDYQLFMKEREYQWGPMEDAITKIS